MSTDVINYRVHPVAALFPYIEGDAFREFVEDIRANGQREPVVLDENGQLLDGRNRARACQELGLDVKETRYSGDDAEAWIISHNVHRRHLTDSQRAMVAAELANIRNGRPKTLSIERVSSVEEAARALNVSPVSVRRARVVRDHGTDEEKAAVKSGDLAVSRAATQINERRQAPERKPLAERAEQITALAKEGRTSKQIADLIGVAETRVREVARASGINISADRVMDRAKRHHDSTRVVENTVTALEALASGLSLIDYDDLDAGPAGEWAASLRESMRALRAFNEQIQRKNKEAAQ